MNKTRTSSIQQYITKKQTPYMKHQSSDTFKTFLRILKLLKPRPRERTKRTMCKKAKREVEANWSISSRRINLSIEKIE